jgi:hypothetical protein
MFKKFTIGFMAALLVAQPAFPWINDNSPIIDLVGLFLIDNLLTV